MFRLATLGIVFLAFAAGATYAAEYTVVIEKMRFGPVPEVLHPGDVIIWENQDLFRHTATARDKSFDLDLPAGAVARMEVDAVGTIEVFCRFHPGMKTTLTVTP